MKTAILNLGRTIFKIPFLEKFLKQNIIGKSPDSMISRFAPNNYQYPIGSIRRFNYKGIQLELDIHDYVSHYLYFGFKDNSHEKLMHEVRPGDIVLDIGTNFGSTILQFAQKVGEEGFCYGFEPDVFNFNVCQRNIGLNSFHNISVSNIGLGNERGEFTLVVDTESNRGGNRIGIATEGKESHTIKVETLDEWFQEKQLTKIDFVKIDVEGFEMNVLKGGSQLIQQFKPTFFIELDNTNLNQQGSSSKELVTFLIANGYSIFHAETNEPLGAENNYLHQHFDIIARYVSN